MKAAGVSGNIGSFPISGVMVNLDNYDTTQLINATAGLIKYSVAAGAVALGAILLAAIIDSGNIQDDDLIPIGSFSNVRSHGNKRKFFGICMTENLVFQCEEQEFTVPLDRICKIESSYNGRHNIKLIDGSEYVAKQILNDKLEFYSLAGDQHIEFYKAKKTIHKMEVKKLKPIFFGLFNKEVIEYEDKEIITNDISSITIKGAVPNDILRLKTKLKYAFENDTNQIAKTIGINIFKRYFIP